MVFFMLPFFISVCDDSVRNEVIEVNCGNLKTGLIIKDQEKIGIEMNKLTENLPPEPTKKNPI